MSTTYTADPTATQAPADPPVKRNPVKETLPADGDAANAASIAQALKVLGDYSAFEAKPFAEASNWGNPIKNYRNARLQERFRIDHGGLPGGKLIQWTEDWTPRSQFSVSPLSPTQIGRWNFTGVGSGGSLSAQLPTIGTLNPSDIYSSLNVTVDSSGASQQAEIRLADDSTMSTFSDNAYVFMEFDFQIRTVTSMDWVMGFSCIGEAINGINHGMFIIRPDSAGVHYKCRTINGGSPTEVDSGVAGTAGAKHRARLEWWGANIADDSAAHAVFFIDDLATPVADITATMPTSATRNLVPCFGGFSTGSVANATLILGPVTYGQITG